MARIMNYESTTISDLCSLLPICNEPMQMVSDTNNSEYGMENTYSRALRIICDTIKLLHKDVYRYKLLYLNSYK
jgi:hypothetical protein